MAQDNRFPRLKAARDMLAERLGTPQGLQLTPSAGRSAMVAQLLQQSQQPQGSSSLLESMNIASKPILAALLARREEEAQRQEREFQGQNRAAIAAALERMNDPNTSSELRTATRNAMDRFISKASPDDPVALFAMEQRMTPPAEDDGTGDDVRERRIVDVMDQFGLTRAQAVKLVDNHARVQMSDDGTRVLYIDDVTASATEINMPAPTDEPPAPSPGLSLWDQSDKGTGVVSTIAAGGSVLTGTLGLPIADETIRARQSFRTQAQSFTRALAINERFPVTEQERIREDIATLPGFFDAPSLMRERMRSLDYDLRITADQAEADANNQQLPQDVRSSQRANAATIRNFLPILGVPESERLGVDTEDLTEEELAELELRRQRAR